MSCFTFELPSYEQPMSDQIRLDSSMRMSINKGIDHIRVTRNVSGRQSNDEVVEQLEQFHVIESYTAVTCSDG